jgi:hypothetical protein
MQDIELAGISQEVPERFATPVPFWRSKLVCIVDQPDGADLPEATNQPLCLEHLMRTCAPAERPRRRSSSKQDFRYVAAEDTQLLRRPPYLVCPYKHWVHDERAKPKKRAGFSNFAVKLPVHRQESHKQDQHYKTAISRGVVLVNP